MHQQPHIKEHTLPAHTGILSTYTGTHTHVPAHAGTHTHSEVSPAGPPVHFSGLCARVCEVDSGLGEHG